MPCGGCEMEWLLNVPVMDLLAVLFKLLLIGYAVSLCVKWLMGAME